MAYHSIYMLGNVSLCAISVIFQGSDSWSPKVKAKNVGIFGWLMKANVEKTF